MKEEINSATWLKKVDARDKNEITWDLSSSVIERFSDYQTKRHELAHMEQNILSRFVYCMTTASLMMKILQFHVF